MSTNTMNFPKEKFTKLLINSVQNDEQSVQIECVLKILTDTLEQINLSIILPQILENTFILPKILGGTEYQKVIPMVNDFVRRCTFVKFQKTSFLNHKLVRLFDYLQENHKMFSLFPSDWSLQMSTNDHELIKAIKILYDLTVSHIYNSAVDEISKERKLHKLYNENQNMRVGITDMKKQLLKEKLNLRWKISAKEAYLQKCNDDLSKKHLYHRYFVRLFKKSMIRKVRTFRRLNVKRKRNLRNDVIAAKHRYELHLKSLKINIMEANEKRKDAMQLLQDKIKMYDRIMAMKIVTKLDLQKTLANITDRIKRFEKAHRNEVAECEKFEEEEQEKLEYCVTNFVINRAAKKIQRYWRDYRERTGQIERKLVLKQKKIGGRDRKKRQKLRFDEKIEKKQLVQMEREKRERERERKEMMEIQNEKEKLEKYLVGRRDKNNKKQIKKEKKKKIEMRVKKAKKMEKEMGKIKTGKERKKVIKEQMAKEKEENMAKDEMLRDKPSKEETTREEAVAVQIEKNVE